jgi:rhodanese-related sulfurtransferase
MRQLQPRELADWLRDTVTDSDSDSDSATGPAPQLLDVREPWEVAICALPGITAIPMGQIPARAAELDTSRPVVCICHHGMRSLQVAMFLERQGFSDVVNLAGGIEAWSRDVDPKCPTY